MCLFGETDLSSPSTCPGEETEAGRSCQEEPRPPSRQAGDISSCAASPGSACERSWPRSW